LWIDDGNVLKARVGCFGIFLKNMEEVFIHGYITEFRLAGKKKSGMSAVLLPYT
jgi:hypothetical protein